MEEGYCGGLVFPLSCVELKACLVSTFLSACLEALEGLVSCIFSDASSYVLPLFRQTKLKLNADVEMLAPGFVRLNNLKMSLLVVHFCFGSVFITFARLRPSDKVPLSHMAAQEGQRTSNFLTIIC